MNHRSPRRGSYAALFAVTSVVVMGFAALATDMALIRLAESEMQSIADAAAHAGMLRLRATQERGEGETIARRVVSANTVVGGTALVHNLEFGIYDGTVISAATGSTANALRLTLQRDVPLTFASIWGRDTVSLDVTAAAATRRIHTIVVMDITNSWSQSDFEKGRAGAVEIFDQLTATAGPEDRIGMVVFTGQFGTEFTPLMLASDAVALGVRDTWANMRTASKASGNDFSSGGKYPQMPREYSDEYGTDHAIGLQMANQMFTEIGDSVAYRAMVVLTDGQPNGTGPHQLRFDEGYDETRWRSLFVGDRRSRDEVIAESVTWAKTARADNDAHIWCVSYKADAIWMEDVAQGEGTYVRAASSADLVPIFQDIAESLPLTLVE